MKNTLIRSLRWGTLRLELAVEVRRRKEKEGRKDGQTDIKSNNPHLPGGEKTTELKEMLLWW